MKTTSKLVIAAVFTLIALVLRLVFVLRFDFPLNDGGLFYSMVQDLQANGFLLPKYTTYNSAQIPFAYPPLAFYFIGLIAEVTRIPILTLFQIVPALFATLTVPVFFYLSLQLLSSPGEALFATTAFVILAPNYEWLIMGGGVTRAPATFFALLTLLFLVYLLKSGVKKHLLATILFGSLIVYTHIEIAFFTAAAMLLMTWFYARSLRGMTWLAEIVAGMLILTAPYWVTVLRYHGPSPFLAALSAGEFNRLPYLLAKLFFGNLTDEALFTPFAVFALTGLFYTLKTRQFFLPMWIAAITFLNQRSFERSIIVPVSLLIGVGLDRVILPGINHTWRTWNETAKNASTRFQPTWTSLIFVLLISAQTVSLSLFHWFSEPAGLLTLTPEHRSAMQWVEEHTQKDSKFLVLSFIDRWHDDNITEWFPALTNRENGSTVQGYEWLPNRVFYDRIQRYKELTDCHDLEGLDAWTAASQITFDFLYIAKTDFRTPFPPGYRQPIFAQLEKEPDYRQVFENESAVIYEYLPGYALP